MWGFPAAQQVNVLHLFLWNPLICADCLTICWKVIWLFLWCRFPVLLHCHLQSWQPEGFGAAHRGRQGLRWVGGCHHTGQVPLTHDLSPIYTNSAEDVMRMKNFWRIRVFVFVCVPCDVASINLINQWNVTLALMYLTKTKQLKKQVEKLHQPID